MTNEEKAFREAWEQCRELALALHGAGLAFTSGRSVAGCEEAWLAYRLTRAERARG